MGSMSRYTRCCCGSAARLRAAGPVCTLPIQVEAQDRRHEAYHASGTMPPIGGWKTRSFCWAKCSGDASRGYRLGLNFAETRIELRNVQNG
jgi:hypothetical protein